MTSWISSQRHKKVNHLIKNTDTQLLVEKKRVYYITNMIAGGSYKYILDLIKYFPEIQFTAITNISELQKYSREFNSNHILLFQYLFFSNITFKNIIDIVQKTGVNLLIPIHDFYFISSCTTEPNSSVHNSYTNPQKINSDKIELLKLAKYVVFPSLFVKNQILQHISLNNYIVTPHIDNKISTTKYIPEIINNTINIAIINELSEVKGVDFYTELFKITNYKDHSLFFHIFTGDKTFQNYSNVKIYPRYNNEEIITLLYANKIHSLTFLNKWGETYCYSLTHALRSGISIIYSNIGAFIERIPISEHHFPVEPNSSTKIVDSYNIIQRLYDQLDYLINNHNKVNSVPIIDNEVIIPDFYKTHFR